MVKLGVNLDHVATIRQRYTPYPDMLNAIKKFLKVVVQIVLQCI